MEDRQVGYSEDLSQELALLLDTIKDLIGQLRALSCSIEHGLQRSADADSIIDLLRKKKTSVDTLRGLVRETTLRVGQQSGDAHAVAFPEDLKMSFATLMADFRALLREEARIEELLCGKGLRLPKGRI